MIGPKAHAMRRQEMKLNALRKENKINEISWAKKFRTTRLAQNKVDAALPKC